MVFLFLLLVQLAYNRRSSRTCTLKFCKNFKHSLRGYPLKLPHTIGYTMIRPDINAIPGNLKFYHKTSGTVLSAGKCIFT